MEVIEAALNGDPAAMGAIIVVGIAVQWVVSKI